MHAAAYHRLFIPVICICFYTLIPLRADAQESADTVSVERITFDDPHFSGHFRQQFISTLQHYPELKHARLRVQLADIKTTMLARPRILVFANSRKNREYLLVIDTLEESGKGLFFRLSDSARIGLISHELAHVVDYHHHHRLGMAGRGFEYLFHRSNLEHRADRLAIHHGFRPYLYRYAAVAFDPSIAGARYASFKRKYYYSPAELAQLE